MVKMYATIFTSMVDILESVFCQKFFTFKIGTFTIYASTTTNHGIRLTYKYKNYFIIN